VFLYLGVFFGGICCSLSSLLVSVCSVWVGVMVVSVFCVMGCYDSVGLLYGLFE